MPLSLALDLISRCFVSYLGCLGAMGHMPSSLAVPSEGHPMMSARQQTPEMHFPVVKHCVTVCEVVHYCPKGIFKSSNFAFRGKIFVLTNSETIIGHNEVKCWGDILSSKTLKKRNIWAATMDVCPTLRLSVRRSKERKFWRRHTNVQFEISH